ncbi:hypothetical protein JG688_00015342, partial [Phytophthora aleatoria]
ERQRTTEIPDYRIVAAPTHWVLSTGDWFVASRRDDGVAGVSPVSSAHEEAILDQLQEVNSALPNPFMWTDGTCEVDLTCLKEAGTARQHHFFQKSYGRPFLEWLPHAERHHLFPWTGMILATSLELYSNMFAPGRKVIYVMEWAHLSYGQTKLTSMRRRLDGADRYSYISELP